MCIACGCLRQITQKRKNLALGRVGGECNNKEPENKSPFAWHPKNCLALRFKQTVNAVTLSSTATKIGIPLWGFNVNCRILWGVNNLYTMTYSVCGYMDWIGLAQDRDGWRRLVSAVMNFRVQ